MVFSAMGPPAARCAGVCAPGGAEQRWLAPALPDEDDFVVSGFPSSMGRFVDTVDAPQPERVSLRDAAERFPSLVDAEMLEDYERAESILEQYG